MYPGMIYIQGAFAGGRVRAAFEGNARRQRKITAKCSLRCQGPLTNIPINHGRLEKLILTTDCVYTVNSRRDYKSRLRERLGAIPRYQTLRFGLE